MNSGENFRRAASSAVRSTFSSNPTFGLSPDWMNPYPPPINPVISPPPQLHLKKIRSEEHNLKSNTPRISYPTLFLKKKKKIIQSINKAHQNHKLAKLP